MTLLLNFSISGPQYLNISQLKWVQTTNANKRPHLDHEGGEISCSNKR